MHIIGLTGGIGSGKSVVAGYFQEFGIPVIDADRIGHDLLDQDEALQNKLVNSFGETILNNGSISREQLAASVFSQPAMRKQINAVMHPAILNEAAKRCQEHALAGHKACIIEAALFGEAGRKEPWLHKLILVLARKSLRIERLMQNRNFSEAEAIKRMEAQCLPESKIEMADWIIENNGDCIALQEKVSEIASAIHLLVE